MFVRYGALQKQLDALLKQNIIVKIVVMDLIWEAKGFGPHQFPPL